MSDVNELPAKYRSAMVHVGVQVNAVMAGTLIYPIVDAFDQAKVEEGAKFLVDRKAPGATWTRVVFIPGRILNVITT